MWVETSKQLPPEGKYVLARHNRGTWVDRDDQDNVNCVVVKLKKGLSKMERAQLPEHDVRKHTYTCDDEDGNNLVPYSFHCFGPDHFFGQSITFWQPIEEKK